MKFGVCLSLVLFCVLTCQFVSTNQNHAEDWIDPLDMVNFDPTSNKMRYNTGSTTESPPVVSDGNKKTTPSSQTVTPDAGERQTAFPKMEKDSCEASSVCLKLFKQYIRRLLYHIDGKVSDKKGTLNMRFTLSAGQVETLRRFSKGDLNQEIHNAHAVITDMVEHVSQVDPSEPSSRKLWLEDLIGIRIHLALPLTVMACVIVLTPVFLMRLHFSWWRVTVKLIFFLFCVSVVWTWYELYKREEAKTHHAIMKDMPAECKRRDANQSIWSTVKQLFSSTFTFQTDNCVTYYEHMLIDPMWKVAPTEALAVTFARFFLAPLRHIGKGISEFLTALLNNLPYHLWPIVLISVGVFLFLLLFMMFGYGIRLPFISITQSRPAQLDADLQLAITQQAEEIKSLKGYQEIQLRAVKEMFREERLAITEIVTQQSRLAVSTVLSASLSPEKQNSDVLKLTHKLSTGEQGTGDSSDVRPDTVGTMSCT
ncbi:chloride channel CLIC-like protein 1 [Gigantopelta aegis]|uniref:chloride channel CLIC-like protein 1 n=1 Tax=Gigantopelta aegis TaxID=1735272 RepID=UPI001B88CEB0|nr:chloride channel CLIC-like protein 1 [Gigantopelta aegis]